MSLKILGPRPYFWQWDSGQKLVVGNCNCDEVHFCNGTKDNALVVKIKTTDDGTRTVDVPNILLQAAEPLKAYLFHRNDSGNMTRTRYIFQVIERPKPEDYIYTEDEILTWQRLSDRIDDLEDNVDCVKTVNDVLPDENGNIEVDVKETLVVAAPSSFPARVSTTGDMIAQAFANKRNVILKFPDGDICNLDSISSRTAVFSKIYVFEGGVGRAVYKVDAGGRCTYSEEIVENSGGNAVLYTEQYLTEKQKAQARENIGVGNGKSAYQYAKDGGYTGTEGEFAEKLASDGFDPTAYGLPVLYLNGDTTGMSKDDAVTLDYAYGERSGTATVKWQGSSSLAYPKKNYTIKFDNAFEAAEGWGAQKKYCLKANFVDHSHARNIVSAKLWGEIVKSRIYTPTSLFDINNVTGAVFATDGTNKSNAFSIADGVITTTLSAVDAGSLLFTGNTFPAGKYTVTLEIYNPNDSTTDNHKQFRFVYGKVGQQGNAYTYDFVSAPLGEWTTVTKEIEFAEDGSMIGFIGQSGRNYQFRNIRVVPAESVKTDTLDHSNLQNLVNGGAIDGFPVCVCINEQHTGLYTFNIPKDGWMFGMGTGEKECILCANNHSAATRFEAAALCDESDFEIEYIPDDENTAWAVESVNRLISAVMDSDGTNLNTIEKYLDIQSAIDFYIFTAIQAGTDNVDKNFILATYDGVKWFMSTYDMDGTFGNHWSGTKYLSATSYPTLLDFNNRLIRLLRNHKTAEVKARYSQLRSTVLSEDNVLLKFENFMAGIPSALYEQDTKLWPLIPGTKTNNISQIANFYRLRVQLLDTQIEQI